MATVHFKDGTSTETPDGNVVNMERLLGDKIKKVTYPTNALTDAVNELARKQADLWNKPVNNEKRKKELSAVTETKVKKPTGRPKAAVK